MSLLDRATGGTGAASAGGPVGDGDPEPWADRGYLRQVDLYRVLACACVVGQHAILWVVPGGSTGGWGFVMLLHFTREAFFTLSAFLVYLAWIRHPPTWVGFWWRRISDILWPYLVWTVISFAYTLSQTSDITAGSALSTFGSDLLHGYYQLYFLVVLAELYVLFPVLVWLVRLTRGYHRFVLIVSVALQLAVTAIHHYTGPSGGSMEVIRGFADAFLDSRDISCYQLYVVIGLLAADHFDAVQRVVRRSSGWILASCLAVGVAVEMIYLVLCWQGGQPGYESDLFAPMANVWFVAAIVGLYCLGYRFARRRARVGQGRSGAAVRWGSNVSAGVYLSHVVILQLVLDGLGGTHDGLPWWGTSLILFATALAGGAILTTILQRTPIRTIVTGPNRPAQRRRLDAEAPAAPHPDAQAPPSAATS